MAFHNHLNTRNNQANFGRYFQLGLKPLPLRFPQHGFLWVGVWHIPFFAGRITLVRDTQFGAKPSGVQQNNLDALSNGAQNMGVVKTFARSSWIVNRQPPKI